VVKIEFLMQKVEISGRESCMEVDKFARERAAPPPKAKRAPAFFKDDTFTLRQDKKFFFLPRPGMALNSSTSSFKTLPALSRIGRH
jgi:hypothetical protein